MKALKLATTLTAARRLAKQHSPKMHAAIDKAADTAATKLAPEHHARIESGRRMAKKAANTAGGSTPPPAAPPHSPPPG